MPTADSKSVKTITVITGVADISYARARLWIGISGVGLIVVACVVSILAGLPGRLLPTSRVGSPTDVGWVLLLVGSFVAFMAPLDFLGGYFVPSRFQRHSLAVVLARRLVAVESGSRTRGILLALAWIISGFSLAASLPGAGVASVSELTTTSLGFTVWTFLGLLTLPTVSRQASYAIDGQVLRRGVQTKTLAEAIRTLDTFQDDEPSRGALIETIFHPVPSVGNRQQEAKSRSPFAWHAARMTLFLSWSCMGLLSRAVHCNVGRPELWVMLPTD